MSPRRERSSLHHRETSTLGLGVSPGLIASNAAPIDRVHLARYTLGSATLEREIVGLFLAQLPLSIEQMRFAATDREWQVATHTIKGSARAVGAWEVSRLAAEAEKMPAVEDEEVRGRILSAMEEACEAVQSYADIAFPAVPVQS